MESCPTMVGTYKMETSTTRLTPVAIEFMVPFTVTLPRFPVVVTDEIRSLGSAAVKSIIAVLTTNPGTFAVLVTYAVVLIKILLFPITSIRFTINKTMVHTTPLDGISTSDVSESETPTKLFFVGRYTSTTPILKCTKANKKE